MTAIEVYGALKSWVKKTLAAATISTVEVTQNIEAGNELAEIDVSGSKTKVYMPTVKINGTEQTMSEGVIDLNPGADLLNQTQWTGIKNILS